MNRHSGNHQPIQGPPQHARHRSQHSYNDPVPIPQGNGATRERNGSLMGGQQQYDIGKSPPNQLSGKSMYHKIQHPHGSPIGTNNGPPDTKHVPCKFFRQGQCQAGTACPFLHTLDPMSHQAPCKYFMKVESESSRAWAKVS